MGAEGSDEWNVARSAALVVAHPDDETLWAGGTVLMHPDCAWRVVALCRASDPDRAPKFRRVLAEFGASGDMADLDDGPEQEPLPADVVREAVLSLLGQEEFDLVLTHGLCGEYTRHRRHEEVSRAVADLWAGGKLRAGELRMFAYEDGGRAHLPRAEAGAHVRCPLPEPVWERKRRIITDVYGFGPDSFEARTTPRVEAFRRFRSPGELRGWAKQQGVEQ